MSIPTGQADATSPAHRVLAEKRDRLAKNIISCLPDHDPELKFLLEEDSASRLHLGEELLGLLGRREDVTRAVEQLAAAKRTLADIEERIQYEIRQVNESGELLGRAAFEGFAAGKLPQLPCFSLRLQADRRVAELEQQIQQLSQATGLVAVAKAKAQQFFLSNKLKAERLARESATTEIGKQLILSHQEDTVQCDQTQSILAQIARVRRAMAALEEKRDHSAASLQSVQTEITSRLGLLRAADADLLERELSQIDAAIAEKRTAESDLNARFASSFLQASVGKSYSQSNPLHSLLEELRETVRRDQIASPPTTTEPSKAANDATTDSSKVRGIISTGDIPYKYEIIEVVFACGHSMEGLFSSADPVGAYKEVAQRLLLAAIACGGDGVVHAKFEYRVALGKTLWTDKAQTFEVFGYGTAVKLL